MSAFFCFQMARRQALKGEAPDLNHKDIIKRMTEEWKALNDAEKQQYVERSNDEKNRYEGQMRIYKEQKAKEVATQKAIAAEEKLAGKKRPAQAPPAQAAAAAPAKATEAPKKSAKKAATPDAPVAPAAAASEKKKASKPATPANVAVATPAGKKSAKATPAPAASAKKADAKASAKKKISAKAATPKKPASAKKTP